MVCALSSPTARTLAWLREQGWDADVVERWVPGANVRRDFLGFADILAIRGEATLAVQACSATDVAKRVAKVRSSATAPHWLASPARKLWIVGWRKYAKRVDGRHWRPIVRELTGGAHQSKSGPIEDHPND